MINNNSIEDNPDVMKFYKDNYQEVYQVTCEDCGEVMALEVVDPEAINPHHLDGRQVIDISEGKLLSTRPRLDGQMGYECICGNDTRISSVERQIVPQGNRPSDVLPHHVAMVHAKIAETGYQPSRKENKDGSVTLDKKFKVEKL